MLMQTLQPLTEALTKLVDRLDRLDRLDGLGGLGGLGGPDERSGLPYSPMAAPGSLPYSNLIDRLAGLYEAPAAFLGAVMMAESGGNPNAVGDEGHSVGLFQLHDEGMGRGLGELRFDAELNAAIGARGLAMGWHEGMRQGYSGEDLVRFAYDYRFNPGGGFAHQGDAVVSQYRFFRNLAERGAGDQAA